jgi:cellulose synthase operon protein C
MTSIRTDRPLSRPSSPAPGSSPPSGPANGSLPPSQPPEGSEARSRVRQLRAEAEAQSDRTIKATLLFEAGYVNEVILLSPTQAVQDYLAAYNADNRSRLPLQALIRMFERRRSYKNLARLYDAEVRSARSPAERGTALTNQALLSKLSGDDKLVQTRLEQALEQEPKADPALLLEWNRRAAGDLDGALNALARRAESSDDPTHRGALLVELAAQREARGEISGALEALRAAALAPEVREEAYAIALGRFARQHGFTEELVEASELRATRLGEELKERIQDHESDPLLLQRLRSRAVAHWYEAARLRSTALSDPLGALRSIEGAIQLAPNDLLFRYLRMLTYDLLEDRARAAEEARALLAAGLDGEQAAALHFRLAEHALVVGDAETARAKLIETIAVAGGSAAAEAILDDLLLDEGRDADRIAQRETEANDLAERDPRAALQKLAEAAQIAAQELADPARALQLFARAEALVPSDPMLLREAYGSALDMRDDALARFALPRLLATAMEPEERAALRHHRFELAAEPERDALIDDELGQSEPAAAVLKLALTHAASRRDYPRLVALHVARSRLCEGEEAAAELCAAARASLRSDDLANARQLLEVALEKAPTQRYALTLLEEVMRRQGDASGAIALLRRAAERHQGERDAELSLLSAGAAAELAGDVHRAEQNYLEAVSKEEPSLGALWSLLRLAQRRHSSELERSARAGLADRERLEGRAGVDTVLLAEHYDLVDQQPAHAEPLLQRALLDDDVGHHAAIALALSRSAPLALRADAIELLATRATDSLRPALLRELGGELVARNAPPARVLELVERTGRVRNDDRWAHFTRTYAGLALRPAEHGHALAGFAEVTTDPQLASNARAEAVWSEQLKAPTQPLATSLRSVLNAPEEQALELTPELAEAVLAHGSPAHDGALRAAALDLLTRGSESEARPQLLLSLARAKLAEGDAAAALVAIEELLARDPDSLAAWELAHEAAERARRPALLADAAEALANALDGELSVELLEQSATVRMDQLDDRVAAERLFARVLTLAPTRKHSYQRLHDLLEARGAKEALQALIRRRTEQVDDPEELVRLHYELARQERKEGRLDAALDCLENVLLLDDEHLGALGLSAEIQTARGKFREAVAALDRLAGASSLPKLQRRLALLGAADFLEHKLNDRAAALLRLERLLALTPDDAQAHVRFADLAERHHAYDRAAPSLERAIELETALEPKIALSVRLADLLAQQLGRKIEAVSVYRRALEWAPDHVEAARSMLAITEDDEILGRLELELRARAREEPRNPVLLRKLLSLAELARDRDLAFIALSALDAIDQLASGEETARFRELLASARNTSISKGVTLSEGELRALLAPSLDGRTQLLLRTVFGAATELEQLEPAHFGVGRAQRVNARDPHALREDLRALASPLGMVVGEVYIGGKDPGLIAALPHEGELGFVLGSNVDSPLAGAARQRAALQLAGVFLQTLPLLARGAEMGARMLYAAMLAENLPVPSSIPRDVLANLARDMSRALPRKVKRALPELVRALPDKGTDLLVACRQSLARTRRLGLLLSGELSAALRELGPDPEAQLDLLRTWLGAPMSTSRRKLGLTQ